MKVQVVEGPLKQAKNSRTPKFRTARSGDVVVRVRVIDADSPSFGVEFQEAFKANVRRARLANKRVKLEG